MNTTTLIAPFDQETAMNMADEVLIREYQTTGNRQYFSILYQRYTHLVFGACLKYLRNTEEGKDMAMAIFEKLMTQPPKDEILAFKSWLHKYIQNECFYHLRKTASRGASFRKFEEMETRSAPTADNEGALRLEKEPAPPMKLGDAIRKLPKAQKECIRWFYLKEKSYKQIVEKTGYSESQVKSYLQNGKRRLKILMSGEPEKG
ncbi:MAG: RNA polymerase sigma factor [Saprospiraceae bacterium]